MAPLTACVTPPVISLLDGAAAPALCEHLQRHRSESGRDGDLVFRPGAVDDTFDPTATIERHRAAWLEPLTEPHWLRTWGVIVDGEIRGHLDLRGGRLAAELHRATLGMGLERAVRGRGLGRALLDTAIRWARNAEFAWIDLGVFANNAPARALYASAGFVEIGTYRDRFRVEELRIDDVEMSLAL